MKISYMIGVNGARVVFGMRNMIDVAEDLMRIFEMLNDAVNKKMISKKVFGEMRSINDFERVKGEMSNLLNQISYFGLNDTGTDEINTMLVHLHFKVSWLERRIDDTRELIEIIIGRYRKLIHDQGMAKE